MTEITDTHVHIRRASHDVENSTAASVNNVRDIVVHGNSGPLTLN